MDIVSVADDKKNIMNYEISHLPMFSHAMDFYGIKEVPGEDNNPQIMQFFKEIGHSWVKVDELRLWKTATKAKNAVVWVVAGGGFTAAWAIVILNWDKIFG